MIDWTEANDTYEKDGKVYTGKWVDTGVSRLFFPVFKTKKEKIAFFNEAGLVTKKGKLTAHYRRGLEECQD